MELDLQKAILNNKQYYIVPEEIFPHLKLSAKEQKGLLKMEFGNKFYINIGKKDSIPLGWNMNCL